MKIIFEITGEFNTDGNDLGDNMNELKEIVDKARCFGSAEGRYKIIIDKTEWLKIEP